jgi:hypothetical protein
VSDVLNSDIYAFLIENFHAILYLPAYGINIPCVEFWYAREVSTLTGGISKHEQEKRWIRPIN